MFDNILRIIWAILTLSFVGLIVYFRKPLTSILHALSDMDSLKAGPLEFKRRTERLDKLLMPSKSYVVPSDKKQAVQRPQIESFPFAISKLQNLPLISLYCLVKSFRSGKEFGIAEFLVNYHPKKQDTVMMSDLFFYTAGVLRALEGFIGLSLIESGTTVKPKHIPAKICNSVEKELEKRISDSQIDSQSQESTRKLKKTIDDYFNSVEESQQSKHRKKLNSVR